MAKNTKVEDYEKLAVKTTGLVAMRFLKDTIADRKGDVAGFEPYTAKRMHDDGLAEPAGEIAHAADADDDDSEDDADAVRRASIEIPTDWQEAHHLRRVSIAKEITGSDASLTAEKADEVIRAELERREAAV